VAGFRLVSVEGDRDVELTARRPLVVGRAADADIPVFDATVSRRHAELRVAGDEIGVKDMASVNGTFINGVRVAEGVLRAEDSVAFGKVVFHVKSSAVPPPAMPSETTILRQLAMEGGRSSELLSRPRAGTSRRDFEREAGKLSRLLEVAQTLSGEIDLQRLLHAIVESTFESMPGDRVSILLRDADGGLVPRLSKNRFGDAVSSHVPRSIAQKAVAERVAILSDNATADLRFSGGQSVLQQRVLGAMCTPLMAAGDEVLGILYVDSLSAASSFTEEDLQFLAAFGGIAAVAIKNSRYAEQVRREATVRANFERYFAPRVAAEIAETRREVGLGGDRRPLAVLFSDIRGFTTLSEGMKPEDIATLLSEYFTEMIEVVFAHDGTLDKFIGDGLLALWGAPLASDEDPDRAVRAAVAMQQALAALNARWVAEGRPRLGVGIGIHYGEAFAGNIGSRRRLEYTILGDTVNTASRLSSAAAPGEILVTEPVRQALRDARTLEPLAALPLKGKSQAVGVYRVTF
jgi:adenylate cyclase